MLPIVEERQLTSKKPRQGKILATTTTRKSPQHGIKAQNLCKSPAKKTIVPNQVS